MLATVVVLRVAVTVLSGITRCSTTVPDGARPVDVLAAKQETTAGRVGEGEEKEEYTHILTLERHFVRFKKKCTDRRREGRPTGGTTACKKRCRRRYARACPHERGVACATNLAHIHIIYLV